MGSESKPLYAGIRTRPGDGMLEMISYKDEGRWEEDYYVIPVSSEWSLIGTFTRNLFGNKGLELKFVDISPLIEKGVIPRKRVFNLDNVKPRGGKKIKFSLQ